MWLLKKLVIGSIIFAIFWGINVTSVDGASYDFIYWRMEFPAIRAMETVVSQKNHYAISLEEGETIDLVDTKEGCKTCEKNIQNLRRFKGDYSRFLMERLNVFSAR